MPALRPHQLLAEVPIRDVQVKRCEQASSQAEQSGNRDVGKTGSLRALIDSRNSKLVGKILSIILLCQRSRLAIQADADLINHGRRELVGFPNPGILVARKSRSRAGGRSPQRKSKER